MVPINYLGVFLAAISFMVLGFLWYSPTLLGKPWMKLKGYSASTLKTEQKKMGKFYALSFILALLTAYILAHVMEFSLNYFHYPRVQTGLTSAFYMWLGFVMPVQTTTMIFGEKKWKLLAIDTGYQLVGLMLMGTVLGML